MSDPCAMALQVAAMSSGASSSAIGASSATIDSTVSVMFVPVSPSGTG